jgi:hypothetical protein
MKGAEAILYNLAFSPKIEHVDFSYDTLATKEAGDTLYKLIKISGSLTNLIMKDTEIIPFLTE